MTDEMLESLLESHREVAVIVYDREDRLSRTVIEGMENIDDDLAKRDVLVFKMASDNEFGKLTDQVRITT